MTLRPNVASSLFVHRGFYIFKGQGRTKEYGTETVRVPQSLKYVLSI